MPVNENYIVLRWADLSCKILFSFCQQGHGGVAVHFAADKRSIFKLRKAIPVFLQMLFEVYPQCEFIFAKVKGKKIINFIKHFGFEFFCNATTKTSEKISVYIKKRT